MRTQPDRAAIMMARLFTRDQVADIIRFVTQNGSRALSEVERVRQSPSALPPLLAPIDLAEEKVDPQTIDAWLTGLTAVVIDAMAAPGTVELYDRLLRRLGMSDQIAERYAEDIASPAAEQFTFWRRVLEAATVGNMLTGGVAHMGLTQMMRALDRNTGFAATRSYELVELGRAIGREAEKAVFFASAKAVPSFGVVEGALGQPIAADEDIDASFDEASALADALSVSGAPPEGGSPPDPLSAMPPLQSADDIISWLEAMDIGAETAYHTYASTNPEQGGRFGRFLKRAVKKVAKGVKALAPMVATAFGGPAAGAAVSGTIGAISRVAKKNKGRRGRGDALSQLPLTDSVVRTGLQLARSHTRG